MFAIRPASTEDTRSIRFGAGEEQKKMFETLDDDVMQKIMWVGFLKGGDRGLFSCTICRGQLVNRQWYRCYKAIRSDLGRHMFAIKTPRYVTNDPSLTERSAFYESWHGAMIENRKRASHQQTQARSLGMKLKEWRKMEARRLKTTIKAIRNGRVGR